MTKREWRTRLRALRAAVEGRAEKEAAMCEALRRYPPFRQAHTVLLYASIGSEPSTRALCALVRGAGKTLCLPRVAGQDLLAVPVGDKTAFAAGAFGIPEPEGDALSPARIDLVLCPGLGFDPFGHRLGYGGGFYDRFLANAPAHRVGLCYSACLVERLPACPHDIPMHAVLTENGVCPVIPTVCPVSPSECPVFPNE